jgi:hypothetical protein
MGEGSFSIEDNSHASTGRDSDGEHEQLVKKPHSSAAQISRPIMIGCHK